MPEFTASDPGSSFPNQNILFNSAAGITGQQIQQNQLGIQQKQLELTDADHEQVARLSASLLGVTDPDQRAQLYARGVGLLQSQGLAKYAPPTVPDDATLRYLAQSGTPSSDIYKLQLGQQAGQGLIKALTPTDGTATSTATPGSTTAAPGTATAPGGATGPAPFVGANLPQGVTPDEDQLVRTVYGEARGEPVAGQQAVASVIKTRMGLGKQGVQDVVFAPNQFEAWSDPKNRPGMESLDPNSPQYQGILNNVVRPVMSGQAQDPTGGATNFYNPQLQAQLGRSTPGFAQGNQTTIGNHTFFYGGYAPRGAATTASATPAPASAGGGVTPPPYTVASNAPVPPPGATAAPGGGPAVAAPQYRAPQNQMAPPTPPAATAPPAPAAAAPQFTYPNGRVGSAPDAGGGVKYADGSYGTPPPGPRVPVAAAQAAPVAPGQPPAQPQPAPASPASVLAPPTAPPAVPRMVTPSGATVPAPPGAPALLSNGLTQQQWAVIQAEAMRPGADLGQIAGQVLQLATSNRTALQQAWQDTHPDLHFQMTGDGIVAMNPKTGQVVGFTPATPTETPRATKDEQGNTWLLRPGQPPQLLSGNPSGVTGTGPEASALRTMNDVAPKIANGTATPQDLTNYASATEIYRNPTIVENANTGEKVRAYTRDLPAGFPPPPGTNTSTQQPPASTPPQPPGSSAQTVTPGMSVSQKGAEEQLGKDFATTDKKSYDAANASLGMLVNANNAAEVLNRNPGSWTATGTGANARLELGKTLNTVSGLFGGQPVVDPSQVSAWEALNKQTKLMGMQVVNNYFGGSREAASIINGATTAVPNSENSYLGFRLVSSGIEQDLLRQRELYEYKAQRVAAGQPLATVEADFNKANPVQTYTARAIANAVPDNIAAKLQANPSMVKDFDQHFGPGIGEFILSGGRTKMGAAGVPSGG